MTDIWNRFEIFLSEFSDGMSKIKLLFTEVLNYKYIFEVLVHIRVFPLLHYTIFLFDNLSYQALCIKNINTILQYTTNKQQQQILFKLIYFSNNVPKKHWYW